MHRENKIKMCSTTERKLLCIYYPAFVTLPMQTCHMSSLLYYTTETSTGDRILQIVPMSKYLCFRMPCNSDLNSPSEHGMNEYSRCIMTGALSPGQQRWLPKDQKASYWLLLSFQVFYSTKHREVPRLPVPRPLSPTCGAYTNSIIIICFCNTLRACTDRYTQG